MLSLRKLTDSATDWRRFLHAEPIGESDVQRLSWTEISRRPEFEGRWVALHDCRFDERTGRATEGDLVDADEDLSTLCARVQDRWKNCAILFVH